MVCFINLTEKYSKGSVRDGTKWIPYTQLPFKNILDKTRIHCKLKGLETTSIAIICHFNDQMIYCKGKSIEIELSYAF